MKLEAKNISIGYETDKVIFPGISFQANAGEMVALLGVNGIGKSTLLRTISGFQKALTGEILINNEVVSGLSAQQRARALSIVLTEKV